MIAAKIQVTGVTAHTVYRKVIPAGIIGAQLEFEYDMDVWSGLRKTVVFRGPATKDVVTDASIVTIPPEVVEKPLYPLSVGVYGVDADGNLAIPTIWADLGIVRDSANPSGDTSTDPSLPVWAQIQSMIGNLEELDTTAKNNLVAAVNEALIKGGGAVDEAEIQRIVDAYLAENPPTVAETDPTVPAWAKEPTKPAYTAAEVGAISQDKLQDATNKALAQAKASGEFDGADGGYYTPSVTQPDANTMRLSFSPSKEGMHAVAETDITLPSGGSGSVAVDSTLTVSGQAADAKAVGDALAKKQDKPDIRTALDDVAVAGAQYYLGEQTELSIVLPADADVGQMVLVSWYNGDTAATLSITGTMLGFDFTPAANTRSEINALWDGRYWAVLGNEMAVPKEVAE